ncbi:MAG: hypothetical protein AAGH60_00835 [Pseudomonadota bacterium]
MAKLLWLLSVALTAIVIGTASAIYASQTLKPTGMVRIGPWEAVRAVGDAADDPYSHAYIAASGQLPPGSAEGMRFVATNTSDGSAIRPDCFVTLSGEVEFARLWTLSITEPDGSPLNAPTAASLHSQDLVYSREGGFELGIGPRPFAPNTMLVNNDGPVALVLHVYEVALNAAPDSGASAMPQVSQGTDGRGC